MLLSAALLLALPSEAVKRKKSFPKLDQVFTPEKLKEDFHMLLKYYPEYFADIPWQKTGKPLSLFNEKITIKWLSELLKVTPRTIYRHMNDELKKEINNGRESVSPFVAKR